VVYRGPDSEIYELALDGHWRGANLISAAAQNTPGFHAQAQSDPLAFVAGVSGKAAADLGANTMAMVLFQGVDENIYGLSLQLEGWHGNNLSTNNGTTAAAVKAAGRPLGYWTPTANRVVYLGPAPDNYIYELEDSQGFWRCAPLSTNNPGAKPAPAAAGSPFGYLTPDGTPRVVYRASEDGHIYELRPEPFWTCNDLCSAPNAAGAPKAAGDPWAYVTTDRVARVLYTDANGDIIELALQNGQWTHADLSTNNKSAAPAPPAAGYAFGYVTPDNVPRVIYRGSKDGHIYELHPDPFWTCNDLCIAPNAAGAPPAGNAPVGYSIFDNIPRVVYRSATKDPATNNHVIELALY
jgi:hypothetical protein